MEALAEHPPPNLPSTPKADTVQEERRPPRAQRRAREVSSRYMMAVASPSAAPPIAFSAGGDHRSTPSICPAFPPPPPKKPDTKQKHHRSLFSSAPGAAAVDTERARSRRSPSPQMRPPSVPSSSDLGDSDTEGSWFGDENRPEAPALVSRSVEAPISSGLLDKPVATQRKRAVTLFRENSGDQQPQLPPLEHQKHADTLHSRVVESRFLVRKPRPGTPMVHFPEWTSTNAVTPTSTVESQNLARSENGRTASRRSSAQVNRSLQETLAGATLLRVPETPPPSDHEINTRSVETSPENSNVADVSEAETCVSSPGALCDSPPICNRSSRQRKSSECRSSMPEADLLPTTSSRPLTEGNSSHLDPINSSSYRGLSSSLCQRSLNSALSSCKQRQFNPAMFVGKLPASLKAHASSVRADTVFLPPQPPAGKTGLDSKKGRKTSSRQEDAHSLRLLENRHLQWRFVNAKAQAAAQARRITAERSLSGLSSKLSELHDSVVSKSIELGHFKRLRTVATLLEAQMPCLVEWATLEDDYSYSLSGAIKSLQDASLRLPIIGNVRADIRELGEALDSATNVLEALAPRVGCLVTKADGMQNVLSELAKVVSEERALVEEFGDLLAEAHRVQVNECSLRIHLIQLKRINSVQVEAEH